MRIIFFLFTSVIFFSCNKSIDTAYIMSKTWSHVKGFKVGEGDFIVFDKQHKIFEIKQDTIYYNIEPKAIIKKLDKEYFEITVTSLNGKEEGTYRNIEESLK